MAYHISASTPKASVAVTRDTPHAALEKLAEFEALGLTELKVTTDAGQPVSRDHLRRLAAAREAVAA